MSTWTDVKNLIQQKLPDAGINVVSPKRMRDSIYAVIDEIIASAPDPVEFEWKATDSGGDSVTYEIGDPVIDDNRWFIAIAQNSNKKPVLPDGSINETYWREENSSTTRFIDDWEAKLFTYSVEIVLHNKKLYLLDRDVVGTAPFLSEDIDAEIAEDPSPWYDLSPDAGGGGIDPADIVNDFSTDPNDASKVAGANAVYSLFQILASNDVDYDTLQEIVDFIKTIDTDGELVAAIDTAVGDTEWRTNYNKVLKQTLKFLDTSETFEYTQASDFRINSLNVESGVTVTIKLSDGTTDYTLGNTVTAFDYLIFSVDSIGAFEVNGEII